MKRNDKLSKLNTKKKRDFRLYNEKTLLGFFSLTILMLATICTFFLNTVQADSTNLKIASVSSQEFVVADDPVTGCPDGYSALGGVITSNPTAGVINSRVVVFARGTDGAVYYQISAGFPFSGWRSLGGGTSGAPMSIVIGTTLYVEVVGTDGNRYYKSTIDGSTYSDWTKGTVGATTTPNAILSSVSYTFVRGASGSSPNLCALLVTNVTPTPTVPTPTPTGTPDTVTGCPAGYTALGGVVNSVPTANVISGRVNVFVRATSGEIYFQYSSGGAFSGWNNLGGTATTAPVSAVIGSSVYVETTFADGNRYYKSSPDGLGFTNWIKGTIGGFTTSNVILGTTNYNFVSGLSGSSPNLCALITLGVAPTPTATPTPTPTTTPTPTGTTDTVTGCPAGYTALGGVVTLAPTTGVVNGRVVAFARGSDGAIYYQYSSNLTFSGWNSLGGNTASSPMTVLNNGTLYVEVIGTDNNRYYKSTTDGVTFSAWTQGTFGATTTSSAILGTTGYTFVNGSTGTSPNLCALITGSVTPTPTPTPTATPNASTGCSADYISLGGFITSDPTTSVFNNKVYVFARGTDGAIYYQYTVGSAFSGWNSLGGATNANPMSIVTSGTLYVEVVGTDSNPYYKSSTDGTTFSNWTAGTKSATTNSVSVFGGKTYTFVRGANNTPHLCVKIQ
ncbi:MAG TPA: hypothetical protein PKY82_13815 [Pyrinomonadaceae bacterium]|nr:hypothetical protein [Pyrinomonadaceae bacterium]